MLNGMGHLSRIRIYTRSQSGASLLFDFCWVPSELFTFYYFVGLFIFSFAVTNTCACEHTSHGTPSSFTSQTAFTSTKIERKLLVCIWRWRRLGRFLTHILNLKNSHINENSRQQVHHRQCLHWSLTERIIIIIFYFRWDAPFHHLWRSKCSVNRSMIASRRCDNWMNKSNCNWFISIFLN